VTTRADFPRHGTYRPANHPRTPSRQLVCIHINPNDTKVSYRHPNHPKRYYILLEVWNQWVKTNRPSFEPPPPSKKSKRVAEVAADTERDVGVVGWVNELMNWSPER
jgi:hypothetical protein